MTAERRFSTNPEISIASLRTPEIIERFANPKEQELLGKFQAAFRSPYPRIGNHSVPQEENRRILGYQLQRFVQENTQGLKIPSSSIVTVDADGNQTPSPTIQRFRYLLAGETALNALLGNPVANRLNGHGAGHTSHIQLLSFLNDLPKDAPKGASIAIALGASHRSDAHVGNSQTFGTPFRYFSPEAAQVITDSAKEAEVLTDMGVVRAHVLHPAALLVSSVAKDSLKTSPHKREGIVSGYKEDVLSLMAKGDTEEWLTVAQATSEAINAMPLIKTGVADRVSELIAAHA